MARSTVRPRSTLAALCMAAILLGSWPCPVRAEDERTIPKPPAAASSLRTAIADSIPALVTAAAKPSRAIRGQGSSGMSKGPSPAQRGALVAGGVVAGMYLGAAIGGAGECSGDSGCFAGAMTGFFVGGALGGVAVWLLTR